MLIQQKERGHAGAFFVEENGKQLAEMSYSITGPDSMIIEHTSVNKVLRGKNIGYLLIERAAAYAREKQYKIIPHCTFAKSVLTENTAQFGDVLGRQD